MKYKPLIALAVFGALGAAAVAGCSDQPNNAAGNDQATINSQLDRFQKNQPIPSNDWSQYRQTVIDVEQAQIHGMATTTFFYNQGVTKPDTCPSIGFPVPTTAQLTNPQQALWGTNASATISQAEPNGVYSGDSSGTYVVCVAPDGVKYIQYWEGFVKTVGGPAHWDQVTQTVALDGAPTVPVTTKK